MDQLIYVPVEGITSIQLLEEFETSNYTLVLEHSKTSWLGRVKTIPTRVYNTWSREYISPDQFLEEEGVTYKLFNDKIYRKSRVMIGFNSSDTITVNCNSNEEAQELYDRYKRELSESKFIEIKRS